MTIDEQEAAIHFATLLYHMELVTYKQLESIWQTIHRR